MIPTEKERLIGLHVNPIFSLLQEMAKEKRLTKPPPTLEQLDRLVIPQAQQITIGLFETLADLGIGNRPLSQALEDAWRAVRQVAVDSGKKEILNGTLAAVETVQGTIYWKEISRDLSPEDQLTVATIAARAAAWEINNRHPIFMKRGNPFFSLFMLWRLGARKIEGCQTVVFDRLTKERQVQEQLSVHLPFSHNSIALFACVRLPEEERVRRYHGPQQKCRMAQIRQSQMPSSPSPLFTR